MKISKLEGVPLGVALRNENGALLIAAISASGSIHDWNENYPDKEIRVGDIIVSVNGVEDYWAMISRLWDVGEMSVVIERDLDKQPEICRRKSRVYLSGAGLKLQCPVDNFQHKRAGDCNATECAICFDDYEDPETRVVVLPCNHVFHPVCAARWFVQGSKCCPLCKQCAFLEMESGNEEAPP
jgi:hypothetical protein